jgi:hypothetical protein
MATCLLDELNELLKKSKLNIPEYQRSVHANGKNHKWLKKNFGSNPNTPERLRQLINMNLNELTRAI